MTHCISRLALLVTAIVSIAPTILSAQPNSPACMAVLAASKKMYTTPNHQFMTRTDALSGGTARKVESITTGGVYYVMARDRWVKGPIPASAMEEAMNNNPNAKVTCRVARSEAVNGAAAWVYAVHEDTGSRTVDGQYWVASGTGLLLRSEIDIDVGVKGGKSHSSMRAEYTNVQAPKIVK